mmetsp:Transcript_81119/g.143043  ORF Transcript_81119/g.143043 Transcript_81119/m.143043 type:complete len:225 (+) Transcript_81119:164-838(+)
MEDLEVLEALCTGPRILSDSEARLVNSTCIRFSPRARDCGILQTTEVHVRMKDGQPCYCWMTGQLHGKGQEVLAEFTPNDIRTDLAEEQDLWCTFCDLRWGQTPADHLAQNSPKQIATESRGVAKKLPVAATACLSELPAIPLASDVPSLKTPPCPSPGKTRTWDPATGNWLEEKLPADILEMMSAGKVKGLGKAEADLDFASVVSSAKAVMAEYSAFFGLPGA